jgi:hypothetical protein
MPWYFLAGAIDGPELSRAGVKEALKASMLRVLADAA